MIALRLLVVVAIVLVSAASGSCNRPYPFPPFAPREVPGPGDQVATFDSPRPTRIFAAALDDGFALLVHQGPGLDRTLVPVAEASVTLLFVPGTGAAAPLLLPPTDDATALTLLPTLDASLAMLSGDRRTIFVLVGGDWRARALPEPLPAGGADGVADAIGLVIGGGRVAFSHNGGAVVIDDAGLNGPIAGVAPAAIDADRFVGVGIDEDSHLCATAYDRSLTALTAPVCTPSTRHVIEGLGVGVAGRPGDFSVLAHTRADGLRLVRFIDVGEVAGRASLGPFIPRALALDQDGAVIRTPGVAPRIVAIDPSRFLVRQGADSSVTQAVTLVVEDGVPVALAETPAVSAGLDLAPASGMGLGTRDVLVNLELVHAWGELLVFAARTPWRDVPRCLDCAEPFGPRVQVRGSLRGLGGVGFDVDTSAPFDVDFETGHLGDPDATALDPMPRVVAVPSSAHATDVDDALRLRLVDDEPGYDDLLAQRLLDDVVAQLASRAAGQTDWSVDLPVGVELGVRATQQGFSPIGFRVRHDEPGATVDIGVIAVPRGARLADPRDPNLSLNDLPLEGGAAVGRHVASHRAVIPTVDGYVLVHAVSDPPGEDLRVTPLPVRIPTFTDHAVRFDPTGRIVAIEGRDADGDAVFIVDASSGRVLQRIDGLFVAGGDTAVGFDVGGLGVAFGAVSDNGFVMAGRDANTGAIVIVDADGVRARIDAAGRALAVSRDGSTVLSEDGAQVSLIDVDNGVVTPIGDGTTLRARERLRLGFTADSRHLVILEPSSNGTPGCDHPFQCALWTAPADGSAPPTERRIAVGVAVATTGARVGFIAPRTDGQGLDVVIVDLDDDSQTVLTTFSPGLAALRAAAVGARLVWITNEDIVMTLDLDGVPATTERAMPSPLLSRLVDGSISVISGPAQRTLLVSASGPIVDVDGDGSRFGLPADRAIDINGGVIKDGTAHPAFSPGVSDVHAAFGGLGPESVSLGLPCLIFEARDEDTPLGRLAAGRFCVR